MTDIFEPNDISLTWSDARLLGYGPMDDTHKEFYRTALALITCGSSNVLEAIAAFERHAIEHFEEEERWMVETDFPPRDCHIEEHAAVLASVRQVHQRVEAGETNVDMVHDLAYQLLRWFPGHADYLDSALASWMTKIKHGGKPVVLRRGGSQPFSRSL